MSGEPGGLSGGTEGSKIERCRKERVEGEVVRSCQEKKKTKDEKRMRRTEEEEVLVKGGDPSVLMEKDLF